MLDAYIIDDIKRRDEERRRRDEAARPRMRIEIDDRPPLEEPDVHDEDTESDDVIQIPL